MQNLPAPTKEPGQRSLDLPNYLFRILPQWITPDWVIAEKWRSIVYNQPVAMICRDTLIDMILALDWKIEPRKSDNRDELKDDIDYYTHLLEDDGDLEYSTHIEWIGQDLLDIPFGGASEVLREGDAPEGKVLKIIPIDAGTLFPTLNSDYPIAQRVDGYVTDLAVFPRYAINRIYMNPRREVRREGWGMAPPEKIYLAMEMLKRGDYYYANLLLDTPEAGMIDLIDMEKEAAEQWVESFRSLMNGIDPWKIPVLYEHTTKAEWIPFGRPPTDLMYDRISTQKAGIIAAGYGMTLSDIGYSDTSNGGETLAGSIRQERRTRRTGFAKIKKKFQSYFNRFLPPELKFVFIDYDEELNVAKGRARMATATAFGQLIDKATITPKEARLQLISDGMMTISMPEDLPEDEMKLLDAVPSKLPTPERPGALGSPVPPSGGGQGEVKKSATESRFQILLKQAFSVMQNEASDVRIRKLVRSVAPKLYQQVKSALTERSEANEIEIWLDYQDAVLRGETDDELVQKANDAISEDTDKPLSDDDWWTLDIDEKELAVILALVYEDEVRKSAQDLVDDLYEHGYLPTPILDPNIPYRLTNERVLAQIKSKVAEIVKNVNDGTKYYLRRVLVANVRRALSNPEWSAKIRDGIDIETILSDNKFMQSVLRSVRDDLTDLADYRVQTILAFELAAILNRARIDQYKRVGLERKYWDHVGADEPCNVCKANMDVGMVPMDYDFQSVFGPIQEPPAHPHEHCRAMYDQGELYSLVAQRGLHIWTGD